MTETMYDQNDSRSNCLSDKLYGGCVIKRLTEEARKYTKSLGQKKHKNEDKTCFISGGNFVYLQGRGYVTFYIVTAKLICVFVIAFAECWFSDAMAQ